MKGDSLRPTLVHAGIEIARQVRSSDCTVDDAIGYLRQGDATTTSFDFAGAVELADLAGWDVFSNSSVEAVAFQQTIELWARRRRPGWWDVLPYGRQKVIDVCSDNMRACFEVAGLLTTDPGILAWWDMMASEARQAADEELLLAGRDAELRSLEREQAYLAGTDRSPIWVAIEDNLAGYDIKSWRRTAEAADWKEHSIEVKSGLRGAIYLSAREWRYALRHRANWEMQLWAESGQPFVLTVELIEPHVPQDVGQGEWQSAKISVAALAADYERAERAENLTLAAPPEPALEQGATWP